MSTDLARALHDAVDSGPDDSPFDVERLTGRIRRRRTVRAGVRGGVAAGAVGALAIGAAVVVGRQPGPALPPARSDAAPGTCGSDVGSLDLRRSAPVGLLPIAEPGDTDDLTRIPAPGPSLGTLSGRETTIQAVTLLTDAELATMDDAEARKVHERLDAWSTAAPRGEVSTTDGEPGAVDPLSSLVARLTEQAARLDALRADPPAGALDVHVVVTHDGVVVATAAPGPLTADVLPMGNLPAVRPVRLDLVACAQPGYPGGAALPAGDFDVYATYRDPQHGLVATGPWPLTLLPTPAAPAGLPADFPAEQVHLVGGRLVSVDRTGSGGWTVVVEVEGTDALETAVEAADLDVTDSGVETVNGLQRPPVVVSGTVGAWRVRIALGHGRVVYTLNPA